MMSIAVCVVVAGIIGAAVQARARVFLAQYLFFLRYPILLGAALVVGPILAVTAGKSLVGNLFVLEGPQLGAVTAMAYFAAGTICYTFNLLFALTPDRTGLPFFRPAGEGALNVERQRKWAMQLGEHHEIVSLLLMAPLAVVLVVYTAQPWYVALAWAALGPLVAAIVRRILGKYLVESWKHRAAGIESRLGGFGRRSSFVRWIASTFKDGFGKGDGSPYEWQQRAFLFFLVTAVVYASGYVVMECHIAGREVASFIPVLVYLILLAILFGWVLAFLSFYFDKFRVPALAPLALSWLLSYGCQDDHYFSLRNGSAGAATIKECSLTPDRAAEAWSQRNQRAGRKPTMVVVAASGGGISASMWTARVLTALSNPKEKDGIGPDFARSIALISSASGGGVGAAYFVDAYDPDTSFDEANLGRVLTAAGDSSLSDTAYAIAYHDVSRVLLPVGGGSRDRGWALEHSWNRWLTHHPTLGGWRKGVQDGWRPTHIFNVTIAETGEPLLLGPFDCPTGTCATPDTEWRAQSLSNLYGGGCDLEVATAARLSATFPWVTPVSRAPVWASRGEHMADGGYYDNFGVVAAIEWLTNVHARRPLSELVEKVIFVQIRASKDERRVENREEPWLYAVFGPLLTLSNVRTTSQRNHNDAELIGLKSSFAMQRVPVPLETVEFELDQEAPLSWHLTDAEKRVITGAWEDVAPSREKLKCLWDQLPENWVAKCHTRSPVALDNPAGPAALLAQAKDAAHDQSVKPGAAAKKK
jgi:hypothetical protein